MWWEEKQKIIRDKLKDKRINDICIIFHNEFLRFLRTSLLKLVDNPLKQIHKINFLSCKKDYSNKFDEESKTKFKNRFKFSNNDVNKFIVLLRKNTYPYEYIDDWEV